MIPIVAGSVVKVLAPFDQAFPGTYPVLSVEGTTAFLDAVPEDMANAFDFQYLEVV